MPTVPTAFPTVNHVNGFFRDYMKISNSSFHGYYGTYERFADRDYEKEAVFAIPNNGIGMAEFLTMPDGMEFVNRFNGTNNLILDIREAWQLKNEPIKTFKDAIKVQWTPLTNNLIERWGMAMVPYDV